VDYIPESFTVTIITNDLSAINRAAQRENTTIMTFGGTYKRKSNSFKCTFSALHAYINSCNISKAFLSTTGISATGALTNSENFDREVRSSILKACPACYLLADSSKFGKTALLTYGYLKDLTACVTDSDLPKNYQILCQRGDTDLIVAGGAVQK
jgi:DeoR family myo-inositol catabolism operon transcriptional repressor